MTNAVAYIDNITATTRRPPVTTLGPFAFSTYERTRSAEWLDKTLGTCSSTLERIDPWKAKESEELLVSRGSLSLLNSTNTGCGAFEKIQGAYLLESEDWTTALGSTS